jgi:murein L,D-transpeptidase YcbB/YkuD
MSDRDNQPLDLFTVKPADALNAWRDAVRAAELAERLASSAAEAAEAADLRAEASSELAEMAQQAADASTRAAERARVTATEAAALASRLREQGIPAAKRTVDSANAVELEARAAYQESAAHAHGDASSSR